jgi:hypothetical protein
MDITQSTPFLRTYPTVDRLIMEENEQIPEVVARCTLKAKALGMGEAQLCQWTDTSVLWLYKSSYVGMFTDGSQY